MAFRAAIRYPIAMVKIPSQDVTRRRALGACAGPRARGTTSAVGTADSNQPGTARSPGSSSPSRGSCFSHPAIVRPIRGTGFDGYMAHEFIPGSGQPPRSLAAAV